jgi:hypothetical protein
MCHVLYWNKIGTFFLHLKKSLWKKKVGEFASFPQDPAHSHRTTAASDSKTSSSDKQTSSTIDITPTKVAPRSAVNVVRAPFDPLSPEGRLILASMVRSGPEPLSKARATDSPLRPAAPPASVFANAAFSPDASASSPSHRRIPASPASAMRSERSMSPNTDREDLRARLMASEDGETRLKGELAALKGSHAALQGQVKMALLSEASDEGERSRQVRETRANHQKIQQCFPFPTLRIFLCEPSKEEKKGADLTTV